MNGDEARTWATYQSAWRELDPLERVVILRQAVAPCCVYRDPQGMTTGINELADYIAAFVAAMPGVAFNNHRFLFHHDEALASWSLRNSNIGAILVEGGSHAEFDEEGKLSRITGFFPAS